MNMRLRFTIENSYRQVIMSTSGSGERLNAEIGHGSSGTFPCAPVRTALLVEDVPEFARGISEAVAGLGEGWRAEHVTSGTDALRAIADPVGGLSLVLVDLELPDMSGVEVIRAARRALPEMPIMVISVLSSRHDVITAVQAGARGYLLKGEPLDSITRSMREVLEGDYPISPPLARHLFQLVEAQAAEVDKSARQLSVRERELLKFLSRGYTYEESARAMSVSVNTVREMCRRIYEKLEVNTKIEAVSEARRRGWLKF
ncbi:MAG: response regulator [Pseudomonadales bacterium]